MVGLLAYIAFGVPNPTGRVSEAYSAMAAHVDPSDPRLVSVASGDLCVAEVEALTSDFAEKLSITPPRINASLYMPHLAEYDPHTKTIHMYGCISEAAAVHEFAHHFLQVLAGDYDTHLAYAAKFCKAEQHCPGSWVASESAPGVELAAHCISHVLLGRHTPLTSCEDFDRLEMAHRVLYAARTDT